MPQTVGLVTDRLAQLPQVFPPQSNRFGLLLDINAFVFLGQVDHHWRLDREVGKSFHGGVQLSKPPVNQNQIGQLFSYTSIPVTT